MDTSVFLAIVVGLWMIYRIYFFCSFCHTQLAYSDRMSNGRVRYRKRGTNFPVCRCCARDNREDVE